MQKKEIEDLLLEWDGKHTDFLKSIYLENIERKTFFDDITDLYLNNKELEHSTSWLIKHHFDNGYILRDEQIENVVNKMSELTFWGSKLHLLQILPKIELSKKQADRIEPEIRRLLTSENKFLKAAAYEAYFEIAKLFPELKNEFKILCNERLSRESASVKVKIRRILNQF